MSYLDWIKKGEDDFKLAELALENGIYDYAAFHAQQAVEKFLKAFLVKNGRPITKTHDIAYLIEEAIKIAKTVLDFVVDKLGD